MKSLLLILFFTVTSNCLSDPTKVVLELGELQGKMEKSTEGKTFYSFMGLPYAKPPIGSLRFKDPEDVEPWKSVLDATSMPQPCLQINMFDSVKYEKPPLHGKEDCLYLNVFTSKPNDVTANLPVIVFIHGGAFFSGSASEYYPHVLLNKEIVLVVLQYRLGTLGFLSTEDDALPGNYGLKDQNKALKWVQRHISNFGGDPLKVTLMGESAGAASTHYHILSPQSTGLFSRAIIHSGAALCPWAIGGSHKMVAYTIAKHFNCLPETEDHTKLVNCLRKVSAEEIAVTFGIFVKFVFLPLFLGPRVDGSFLPDDPNILVKEGRHNKVDLMTGVTRDEGGILTYVMYANEPVIEELKQNFNEFGPISLEFRAEEIDGLQFAKKAYDDYIGKDQITTASADSLTKLYGDRHFANCVDLLAMFHHKNVAPQKKTYLYEFKSKAEFSLSSFFPLDVGKHWVAHVDDLFYFFSGGEIFPQLTKPEDLKTRTSLLTLWTNFATYGRPTVDNSLGCEWLPVSTEQFHHLAIDNNFSMEGDQREKVRQFWISFPTKQNLILFPEKFSKENEHREKEEL